MRKTEEKTPMDQIEELYPQIKRKNELFQLISKEFDMTPVSVKTNWFYTKSIPADKQAKVVEIMQDTIAEQKKSA